MRSGGSRGTGLLVKASVVVLLPACSLVTDLGSLGPGGGDAAIGADGAPTGDGAPAGDGGTTGDGGGTDGSVTVAHKRIFYTSGQWLGNQIGGIAGADTKCNTAAKARNMGGTFKAWISDSKTDAHDRIADVGPWYSIDGKTLIFPNKAALDYLPSAAIVEDDTGTPHAALCYWTGTHVGGTKSQSNCGDWGTADGGTNGQYGTFGLIGRTDQGWTDMSDGTFPCYQAPGSYGQVFCSDHYAVLCVEQ